ncbi:MAG TPA: hypothetical protein DCE41_17725 [Cytophagales bacterium]|nr:hypothetical protein [Cytophagales bacterium]HAA23692.1 hypothetical protein [Cytophagales bacterium]HAP62870.1 hypothetical protein [Cytophagales bacterium]
MFLVLSLVAMVLLSIPFLWQQRASDMGILKQLPPRMNERSPELSVPERELLAIKLVSDDQILANEIRIDSIPQITTHVIQHVQNQGVDSTLSSSPEKAIVSILSDRGISYDTYIAVLDAVDRAYNQMYAEKLGITVEEFRSLDRSSPRYQKAKEGFPKQVSITEPTDLK